MLKSNIDFMRFFLSEHSAFRFGSLFVQKLSVSICLQLYEQFSFWHCNAQNCISEYFFFHMGIMSEHLFQCVTHMSHFDTGSNTADQMFNIVAGVACVTLT
jgi:hypothetical protein